MELRLAWGSILRRPVVSAAIVITVALAVSASTALFSVLDGLLFRALPFENPGQLVAVEYRGVDGRLPDLAFLPDLADRRQALRERLERSPLVAAMAQAGAASFFLRNEAGEQGLRVHGVDAGFFRLLGLRPQLGETFSPEDERHPAVISRLSPEPLPVVIGHQLWQRLYGGDPGGVGPTGAGRSAGARRWRDGSGSEVSR